ncbi:uncharacterized protein LOC133822177 isoform X2 [Humulus lupulus]|uniref:uncharacterized protein LOC133822177 isoform X2 n=1 Tax=Humulus lupulus TaxID=3486 RepID=UPI002B40DF7F|nr:uncharacterized protein LOC133822177 isoform X2 [Humulus lupulus]
MDAYQQQNWYMRPPPPPPPPQQPPSSTDPYQQPQQQQQPPPPPRPPAYPQGSWYPNQYQYQPPSHSPSPPPQWAPPPPPHPHSDHYPPPGSYPPPQHHYPPHPVHQNQFPSPPPRPQLASSPHFPPPHSYPQPNQEWGNPNWAHSQGWEHQVGHNNEEDWAAKARAWADAKTAMENQHQQSQFTAVGRPEDQSHYHDQYSHSVESHYAEIQHQSMPTSNYQQVQQLQAPTAPFPRPPVAHHSESPSVSSDPSYVPEGHLHSVRDGTPTADSNAMFQRQGNLPISPSVHQQEVPSSYSSVTGSNGVMPFSNSSSQQGQHHMQPPQAVPLADQPLEFMPKFNRDDPLMQSSYAYHDSVGPARGMDTVTAMPSMNSWSAPVAPGVGYPPIAPILPSGPQQHDPALAVPSSVSGHAAHPFSSFPVSGLQPTIPSAAPPFAHNAGTSLHPTTAFSGDAYGIPSISERPKKASVPNWLKEEIKKAVITTSSSMDHPKEETQSIEDEGFDNSVGKGEQADSKSIDSSRSTEEDEDDEDYVDAARTAAINHEIKRVLTEVLLKVTDELFDEIATNVLNEDLRVEVDKETVSSNHRVSPSPSTLPSNKPTTKIIIPGKSKEYKIEGVEKSSSSSPGDVLGLGNYATDDDDGDEIQSSSLPNSRKKELQHSYFEKPSEDKHDVGANGSSLAHPEELNRKQKILESETSKATSVESKYSNNDATANSKSDKIRKNESNAGGSTPDGINVSRSKNIVDVGGSEPPEDDENVTKTSKDSNQVKEVRTKAEKNDRHDSKRSSGKGFGKKEESDKRTDEKGNGNHRRHDERYSRKEKTGERNGSKERTKEQSDKLLVPESESKKRSSHVNARDDRKETERQHKAGAKEESNRKHEHTRDKESERSRHKHASDSSRHKRRRSISRGRSSKDDSVHRDNDSSDEASNDSKRKLHSRRRNVSRSPSPGKSRRRLVSRSPHSKHSQRRHSPYSSLDNNRAKRSRSRSPSRRQR